jgi:peptide/nickel transport system permease protein
MSAQAVVVVPAPPRRRWVAALGSTLGLPGRVSSAFLLVVVIAAVLAPALTPTDPNTTNLLESFQGFSAQHWLGTDSTGRDIAARLLFGARTSLLGPAAIVVLALAISVPLGLVAAWTRGWPAGLVNRAVDVVFAVPGLLLAILTVAIFGPGLTSAVSALAVAYTPFLARVVISAAEAQRRQPYVDVLTVQGVSPVRIMVRHVLRNIGPIVVGQATITFAYALLDLAALSFLGLGVQAPQSDWGVMVSDRDAVLQGHPQQVVIASVAIVLTVLALLVVGARLGGETVTRRGAGRRRRKERP